MKQLTEKFQHILSNSTEEDLAVLSDFIDNFEKKQQGKFTTYLSASLNMKRETMEDASTVTIPNTSYIQNNMAIPHGGILAVLLDTAMGSLANSKCLPGFGAVTTNLTIHYLTVADEAAIQAVARIVRQGRHTIVVEGNIVQQDGTHVATAIGSFFIVPK
ncbi:PaaI family thioesterase [Planomicrobium sp. CPCC 101079]|uniref:PaaI family thioesterase n=1 Tax=Planomicrobium sp. CPCC 101079 TaxID=2599618 RepID=UPI0011B489DE|nr:PaaI family thioesterase [Planomicrobium sp. CPCC 101079]TWT04743.1 PaaI family thioesterase [Planomicrobium sp. CPCC 101079]